MNKAGFAYLLTGTNGKGKCALFSYAVAGIKCVLQKRTISETSMPAQAEKLNIIGSYEIFFKKKAWSYTLLKKYPSIYDML